MTKNKKTVKEPTGYRIYAQYVLVGAALGLYYGAISRTSGSTPDYGMSIVLALLAGTLTTVVRNWRKKNSFQTIALDFVKITALFLVFLLALQLRSVIESIAGRAMVAVFMTSLGALMGLIMGMRRKPASS